MADESRSIRQYITPVAVSMGTLCVLNGLWFHVPQLKLASSGVLDHALLVYLVGGSGLALVLLWRALQDGRLSPRDVGLQITGWTPWKRLVGVALIVVVAYGGYSTLDDTSSAAAVETDTVVDSDATAVDAAEQTSAEEVPDERPTAPQRSAAGEPDVPTTAAVKPTWSDFCFWYVMLLAASLAELLVFICIAFCMVERGLRGRGTNRFAATMLAMLFASVTFGLYHYTHDDIWWTLVFVPLMPVMLVNLVLFVLTRNFYLTLGLHNSFAAFGMTQVQSMNASIDPAARQNPDTMLPVLVAFVVPFLVLHLMEMTVAGRDESSAAG